MVQFAKPLIAITLGLTLSGCAVFEAFLNALVLGSQEPKLVYVLPDQSVQVAAHLPSDRLLGLGPLDTFDQDGATVREIRLAPDETAAAVLLFSNFDAVLEVFATESRERQAFFTDNTLQSSIAVLCGPNTATLAEALAAWQAEGQPDSPPTVTFPDTPNNHFQTIAWLDDTTLAMQTFYEVATANYGGGEEEFQVLLQPDNNGGWAASSCETSLTGFTPRPDLPLARAHSVEPGPVDGDPAPLTIDNAAALLAGGNLAAPNGAIAAHGGFR